MVPAVAAVLRRMALVWTWPLALHFRDHIPGLPGDNYSFLWNLWWMRKALSAPELEFFRSTYLFSPFGVDLINHPHTALQGYISATALAGLSVIEAENLYIIVSVVSECGVRVRAGVRDCAAIGALALLAGVAFGGSPYVAAQLLGHFDLLTAWVHAAVCAVSPPRAANGSVGAAIGVRGVRGDRGVHRVLLRRVPGAVCRSRTRSRRGMPFACSREPRRADAAAVHGCG